MPMEHVLAQDFGCWCCATNFYGLVLSISEPGTTPLIQWYWAIVGTNGGWFIDYPSIKLDEYIAKRKAAIEERDDRVRRIQQALEPRIKSVKTRLTAVSNRFVIGQPMLFRLELVNSGQTSVHYMDKGLRHQALTVLNEKSEPIPHAMPTPLQMLVRTAELAAGSSFILVDMIDINQHHEITKPGKYFVQFNSTELEVGQPLPHQEVDDFGENLPLGIFNFLPATNKFPSNVIEIEVNR